MMKFKCAGADSLWQEIVIRLTENVPVLESGRLLASRVVEFADYVTQSYQERAKETECE